MRRTPLIALAAAGLLLAGCSTPAPEPTPISRMVHAAQSAAAIRARAARRLEGQAA